MNQFKSLLLAAATEVRKYKQSSPNAQSVGLDWLEGLAKKMEAASRLEDSEPLELAIGAISHSIMDGGPVNEEFAPSFDLILDAVQRQRKRRGK